MTRLRGSAVLAGLLALGLLALPTVPGSPVLAASGSIEVLVDSDGDPSTPRVREFAGATRYETSLAAAQRYVNTARASGDPASTVIVASGESLIDAAAAAGLARSLNAPVLLTPTSTVFAPAGHLIEREGISRVVIVGGSAAVSPEVEAALRVIPGVERVERLGGSNRFDTAGLIASNLDDIGGYCNSRRSAVMVVGDGDSLAEVTVAGPTAYAFGIPILLTSTVGLPAETVAAIRRLGITQIVLLGRTVNAHVLREQLAAQNSGVEAVIPIPAGRTTSPDASVAAFTQYPHCLGDVFDDRSVALVSSTALADGISAAPVLGQGLRSRGRATPVLLVEPNSLPVEIENYLRGTTGAVQITAVGGTNAISAYVAEAAVASANRKVLPLKPLPRFASGDPQACRLSGRNGERPAPGYKYDGATAGFPLPTSHAPLSGVLKVAVLFVDFPDAAATYSTEEEAADNLAEMERYLETVSYGKIDVQVDPLHMWLRIPENWRAYKHPNFDLFDNARFLPLVFSLADPHFDFSSGYDSVLVVTPSRLFNRGTASTFRNFIDGEVTFDRYAIVGSSRASTDRMRVRYWWETAAHEIAHGFGLPDLYPYDHYRSRAPSSSQPGRAWKRPEFGLMGLYAHLSVDQNQYIGRASEMLAWSRWQLTWLGEERVACLTERNFEMVGVLDLISDENSAESSMVVIPTSETNGIVIEARRNTGYDNRRLRKEGLLIYEVNSRVGKGDVPLRFWYGSPSSRLILRHYPILGVGETATGRLADGSTLSVNVQADEEQAFIIKITRN